MNDQKKVNLLPDRCRDLQVGLNLLYQAIRSDQGVTLPYLGVHQGHREVLSEQILPDPEVLSDQVQVPISPDPVLPLDHRQLAQDPDPTHPERMTGYKKNCDINVQNPLDFLLFK